MTAYFIAIRRGLNDPEAFQKYRDMAAVARIGHAMTPLAAYGRVKPVEGPSLDGAVILSFPTFEEAEAWYNSDAYQEALPNRINSGEFETFIVEGLG